jgi:hypothetical protein
MERCRCQGPTVMRASELGKAGRAMRGGERKEEIANGFGSCEQDWWYNRAGDAGVKRRW